MSGKLILGLSSIFLSGIPIFGYSKIRIMLYIGGKTLKDLKACRCSKNWKKENMQTWNDDMKIWFHIKEISNVSLETGSRFPIAEQTKVYFNKTFRNVYQKCPVWEFILKNSFGQHYISEGFGQRRLDARMSWAPRCDAFVICLHLYFPLITNFDAYTIENREIPDILKNISDWIFSLIFEAIFVAFLKLRSNYFHRKHVWVLLEIDEGKFGK